MEALMLWERTFTQSAKPDQLNRKINYNENHTTGERKQKHGKHDRKVNARDYFLGIKVQLLRNDNITERK